MPHFIFMIMDQEKTFEEILELFAQLPKEDREPTFIEICRYPYNRQEEICSRILRFFLDPNAEHKLYDLWLSALWRDLCTVIGLYFIC
ncbi:hypothetical protein HR15_02355 [Porphyromonas gulae]|uniref:Uncharacterized protein n=1 Tax=Porphyromonas gulae TaxID=111105 RepID=A0A0A2FR44_9PORP|nr:hypothetical protein HR15_02355 [Porphyromonas gulae]